MAEYKEKRPDKHQQLWDYYVLMNNKYAKKKEKIYYSSTTDVEKFVSLEKGELLRAESQHDSVKDSTGTRIFDVLGRESLQVRCSKREVQKIDEETARLLFPIVSYGERLRLLKDPNALRHSKKMKVDCVVYVKVKVRGLTSRRELQGVIRFKGPIYHNFGILFGVEIVEGTGKGNTNGFLAGQGYFHCKTDCGVFASLEELRICKDPKNFTETNKSSSAHQEIDAKNESALSKWTNKITGGISNLLGGQEVNEKENKQETNSTSQEEYEGHKLEDRVWVYPNDKPCAGFIKYIGRIPGESTIYAGIHLDQPCGMGNGEFYGKQLFTCPKDHAHFTPIKSVVSEEKFKELYEQPDDIKVPSNSTLKKNPPPAPQTSEDIVKMECKFSKQSTADVIKEQQEFLEKIKIQKQLANEKNLEENTTGIRPSLDESWRSRSEDFLRRRNHVSEKTLLVNGANKEKQSVYNQQQIMRQFSQNNLEIGSMVEVLSKGEAPRYGVIRWLGFVPGSDKKIAGLELENEMDACTDGTFLGKRYFTCPSRRGFFVHLHNCRPDSRFTQGRNSMEAGSQRLTGTEFGNFESPIVHDCYVEPPSTLDVYLRDQARGIQGHHNSCYLDATLFGAFAFSSIMDSILLRPKADGDIEQYNKVQDVLRDNIVYPLRLHGFVRADRVLELRELLDKLGTVSGLVGEEKDPEEFLLTLFQQVLKSEPFLKLKSGKEVRNEYFYQVFADKDAERVLPSVEELLKRSFHQSNLKLAEVPSCLIVQMPRFGRGFKMYNRILPSLTINVGELVDDSPQECAVCGRLAKFHCRDCFKVTGSEETDSSGNFCTDCNKRVHSHVKRTEHQPYPLRVSQKICEHYANKAIEPREMELFAVICIETSHYVTFAKYESPDGEMRWCFFDSMADRVGSQKGYNIPAVTDCPEVIEWLSTTKQNRDRIINTKDKDMPDKVRRLLGDAYVCLYQSKEMAMYK